MSAPTDLVGARILQAKDSQFSMPKILWYMMTRIVPHCPI